MANKNANLLNPEEYENIVLDTSDLDEIDDILQEELKNAVSELEFIQKEKEKIGNPDELGKVILDEVWQQFGNQIGLDITNETLIQKYDREHPETYDEVGTKVMQDKKYRDANKEMKSQKAEGDLTDTYTGKNIGRNESANLDHVVPRKEIYDNKRRKQANISTEDLANKSENLKATTEALNKSKKEKSVEEYTDPVKRAERETDLLKRSEAAKRKIDKSDMSDVDKRLAKEKIDKRTQDKLDADSEKMNKADKDARKAINKDINKGVAKEVGKKAAKDALKTMVVSALFAMLQEIMNGLVRFFKSKSKSFKEFLEEMKLSIKSFFTKIKSVIKSGASSVVGTIVSEIFGPIVSMFKKLASLIKQGISSLIEAVRYLSNKKNKDRPTSEKIAEVGKIVTGGIVAGGAVFLGELFEKILLTVPGMQIPIPLLGTPANVIGLFLASLVCGVIGAIVINLIDKFIAKKQKEQWQSKALQQSNKIIDIQNNIYDVNVEKTKRQKEYAINSIAERHRQAAEELRKSLESIFDDSNKPNNQELFDDIDEMLLELED